MSIRVCYIIIYILEACILWQYCRNLFPSKYSRQREAITLFFCYSILYIGSLFDSFWINFFMFLFINFIFISLTYHIKILTAFFHSMLITMIMVLSELGILSINSYFAPDFYSEGTYFRNVVITSVTSKLLYFLVLQCTSLYIKHRMTRELTSDKSTLFLNIVPLISGFIALTFADICMNIHLSLFQDILITISTFLLLAINIFVAWFHTSIQEKNREFLDMQLLLQKEYDTALYFDSLHQHDEKQKILIHDIRRHLLSIADLNEKGDTAKIAAYINQIIQSSDLQDSVRVCDNSLLNTIIFRAKQQCKEHGTSFITDIRAGCTDFLSEYDITALFSNLLDNAVHATKHIPDSYIELSVTPHSDKNIIIAMINSCNNNPFLSNSNRLTTTKNETWKHGYGMKSIKRVVNKYEGNFRYYFDAENYTFHTVLILKKIRLSNK